MKTIYIMQICFRYQDDYIEVYESLEDLEKAWKKNIKEYRKIVIKALIIGLGHDYEKIIPKYNFDPTDYLNPYKR